MNTLITTTEAGKLLNCTRRTVNNQILKGKIQAYRFGRMYLIQKESINKEAIHTN
jgi:excisionase family DNA binding protein